MDDEMPRPLRAALCEQLRYLDTVKDAREIAASLCGVNGPFGQAEVLQTEHGSECFRYLSEISPDAACAALEREFGDWSDDQLRGIRDGRRNMVNALERLVFRRDLFPRAARLLLLFAAAENETWSNNATGQFLQLFHLYLSGTEMPAMQRLEVVEYALASDAARQRALAV